MIHECIYRALTLPTAIRPSALSTLEGPRTKPYAVAALLFSVVGICYLGNPGGFTRALPDWFISSVVWRVLTALVRGLFRHAERSDLPSVQFSAGFMYYAPPRAQYHSKDTRLLLCERV